MAHTGEAEKSVLITQADLNPLSEDARYRDIFYVEEIDPVLEAKRSNGQDAIREAVGLLLTQAAITVIHVDTTRQHKAYSLNDPRMIYEPKDIPIGFNDHNGGSESDFKILLNGSPEDPVASYVLYSPPNAEGVPTNTQFHRSDFTFLSWESKGQYLKAVPNPLKTHSAHSYVHGHDSGYRHFLFGGSDTPRLVYESFAAAGFGFMGNPYNDDIRAEEGVMTTWTLSDFENTACHTLGYRGMHFWPGDQFAENLKALGLEVPKFSPKDYPLVRPENALEV